MAPGSGCGVDQVTTAPVPLVVKNKFAVGTRHDTSKGGSGAGVAQPTSVRLAPVRVAPPNSTLAQNCGLQPASEALDRLAAVRLASCSVAALQPKCGMSGHAKKEVPERLAPVRLTPERSALTHSAPDGVTAQLAKEAPERFA